MITCDSPLRTLQVAHVLAQEFLPDYASPFSRHDFTLPQLFACLTLKEKYACSYRRLEALLRDSPTWRQALGMTKTPDHNTLWRAARFLLDKGHTDRFLDTVARWSVKHHLLGVSKKPLVIDTTYLEPRRISRHYEKRCQSLRPKSRRRGGHGRQTPYSRRKTGATVRRVPKLALAAAGHNHLILALESATGTSGDTPHWPGLLADLRRRLPYKHLRAAADAGFDSHENHVLAREHCAIDSLVPAGSGYQGAHPEAVPTSGYRRQMQRRLATPEKRKACGYNDRCQIETVNSMLKRNYGSAVRGQSAWSRKRELHLKAITHDVGILLP